eukprot:1836200-Pleurochrysis_carterae.AAC.1
MTATESDENGTAIQVAVAPAYWTSEWVAVSGVAPLRPSLPEGAAWVFQLTELVMLMSGTCTACRTGSSALC